MDRFYENFKTFDTARSYNEWLPDGKDISEYMLGEWMNSRKNRNNVVVVTKAGFQRTLK
jgi:aryl-alcohol dehydrogenase-like predicted oxidoreductase